MFQNSVLKKHLATLSATEVDEKYQRLRRYFGNPTKQDAIRELIEIKFQDGFLRALFVDILGYTMEPDEGFNLTREEPNETKRQEKADGAIVVDNEVVGVIELKDMKTTDLSKIKQQAFGYKIEHKKAVYVVTSNFQKLRFYIDDATEHLEFDLFNLSKEDFEILYLCLSWASIKNELPKKIKSESSHVEENVTKRLYRDYHAFKTALFQDLCENNSSYDKLTLFRKTQKLLDRFLFILFAEDKGLLNPNQIQTTIEQWEAVREWNETFPLYERFKLYFNDLNKGNQKAQIFPYNGGLFKPDEILDSVIISDEILKKHTLRLASYDFDSEVDVNILGHIFEHSLAEIEQITNQLTGQSSSSKRKKDGIFYTPKYITRHIVRSTIGKLCEDKKIELGINDEQFQAKKRYKKDRLRLQKILEQYRTWLLDLKICDPACGSGAFLNQALDFLVSEHHQIDEYSFNINYGSSENHKQKVFTLRYIETKILENNLYGVDINEEAVEIAKLSLWLRSAEKGRKLNDLSNRIKQGDSLIDAPSVAGELAFSWEKEFPEVFESGGFDCIIGNPPYVRVQQLRYEVIDYLKEHYKTALKRIDLSLCFIELSKKLIKKETGLTSFITSNQFLTTEYGQAMRKFLLEDYCLLNCVDFCDLPIFEDALTYVSIFTFQDNEPKNFEYCRIPTLEDARNIEGQPQKIIKIKKLTSKNWNLKDSDLEDIFSKMHKNSKKISEIGNAWAGLFTGKDELLMFDKTELDQLDFEEELLLPVIRANNCDRYHCSEPEVYVIYPYLFEDGKTKIMPEDYLQRKYPKVFQYLLENKEELGKRKDSRKTFGEREDWYSLVRFGQKNIFEKEKIVSPGEIKEHKFSIDQSCSGFSCARVFAILYLRNDLQSQEKIPLVLPKQSRYCNWHFNQAE